MSDYEITNFELHVLLRHYWRKNLDAKAAAKAICDVEGEGTVAPRTAQKWFRRFNEGDFDLEDRPRSGRPTVLDEGDLQAAWMLGRHQAHANWLKNLVSIRRQFGIISSNLTLSTKSHDKIHTS
jgi:transposase